MNIIPIGERVVLKSIKKESKTSSGIFIPETGNEKPVFALVVEISNEVKQKGIINIGDKVIYAKYKGTTLKEEDDEYIVVDLEDILAKVED